MSVDQTPQPPMDLGDTLDYSDYRRAAHEQIRRRQTAVANYERQVEVAADAEATYQRAKAKCLIALKAETGVSSTEAVARIKGEDEVAIAMIERDLQQGKLKARLEDIATVDESSFHLRKVGDWSMRLLDLGPQPVQRTGPRGVAA